MGQKASKKTTISADHPIIRQYYSLLKDFQDQRVKHEGAVSTAFENMLTALAKQRGWIFIPLLSLKTGKRLVPDGTIRDGNGLPRGYWEAKDTDDNLDEEIAKKKAKGYPLTNIIFEDTRAAVLYQSKQEVMRVDLSDGAQLVRLLQQFFSYIEPDVEGFERAVVEFKDRVPELAKGLMHKIKEAHKSNKKFIAAFEAFYTLCQNAIDPKVTVETVEEMLVQHLLTERLFRTIFDNPEFIQRNAIAREVETVIDALVSKSFSRTEYLKSLDSFYIAIENAARTLPDFTDKQHFLNTVYEQFFQGYSTRLADTHGIVYTPQPIVDFMSASVVHTLKEHFSKTLGEPNVNVLDPCTGTGNFIVNLVRRVPKRHLTTFYKDQLFANEILLLGYYIAALNIEHAYYEITNTYEAFEGLCFVDTLDIAEAKQAGFAFLNEANTQRVERQKRTPITVIIGNPPYNMGQKSETENNKNRSYKVIDSRIRETYAKDSTATLKSKYYDPYVRFFRWAVDRLGDRPGVVCYVSNNKFVDTLDGMQKHFLRDFTRIYHIDLHGDVNKDRTLSGTQHNVFGIKVGVGITIAVRQEGTREDDHSLYYHRVPERWTRMQKLAWLAELGDMSKVPWEILPPKTWLQLETAGEFNTLVPLGTKETKAAKQLTSTDADAIFKSYTVGVLTARDDVAYDFNREALEQRMRKFVEDYNGEVDRYKRAQQKQKKKIDVDEFVHVDLLKWTHNLKQALGNGHYASVGESNFRRSLYRPFCKKWLCFDRLLNERVYLTPALFPNEEAEAENVVICCTTHTQMPFICMVTNCLPNEAVGGRNGQCFGFYTYSDDGHVRSENITDWALQELRDHYADSGISKWDIFHYVYAVLHHPLYREHFAQNLRNEIPRVPLVKDFWKCSEIGRQLKELHLAYESVSPHALEWRESATEPLSYRVTESMVLSREHGTIRVNSSLTLAGIPAEAFDYVLGTRSALEWVVDQYHYDAAPESDITSDPNDPEDEEFIVRLIERVTTVSLSTVKLVKQLPLSIEFVGLNSAKTIEA
ncbi:MAG TPA: type ISP restriction/modification enzyme [Alloacidobacterium sp.]|jgi:predicted helicase|nr:type ISP restriction/modification enzyme [Alloacidobacterium sp.]